MRSNLNLKFIALFIHEMEIGDALSCDVASAFALELRVNGIDSYGYLNNGN